MSDLRKLVEDQKDRIISIRRDLHKIPETAFNEEITSKKIAGHLKKEGLTVRTGIAETGVVGLMDTGKPGDTLMIRCDMDALPMTEETGLPFSSIHEGVMHSCGHDGHMAMVLGAVSILNTIRDKLRGQIKFLFQPAEEGPGGAKPMIDSGVMEDPRVDYSIGCHLWPDIPEGTIGVKNGILMAAMDRFDITIIGNGGHGAMPHQCVDALDIGAQVISGLQRIVSRQINPREPAVISVGKFHAGSTFNVIPGKATMSGTTRTFSRDIWDTWQDRIKTVTEGICNSRGAKFEMNFTRGYPPLVNDPIISEVVRRCAHAVVGSERIIEPEPAMSGEDMAFYLEKSKGCFFFLGTGRVGCAPLHNPKFEFSEEVMLLGVEMYCLIALDLLKREGKS